MKVSVPVEFEVEGLEDDELDEDHARYAAEEAIFNYLAFVKISGYTSSAERVEVLVDGYGRCTVEIVDWK